MVLVEKEVGRLYGGDRIKPETFLIESRPVLKDPVLALAHEIKEKLYALSLDELVTYSFYGEKAAKKCFLPLEKHLEVENPFSKEAGYMRLSLMPILLEKMALNLPNFEKPQFFEIGHVFDLKDEREVKLEEQHKIRWTLYEGKTAVYPDKVFVRGKKVVDGGKVVGERGYGELCSPAMGS